MDDDIRRDEEVPSYEPPRLEVLATVTEVTFGSNGSFGDGFGVS